MLVPTRYATIRNTVFAAATAGLALTASMGAVEAKSKHHHHLGIVLNVGEPYGYIRSGYGPPC